MTKEEAIQYLQQLYPNGGHCWLDEQRIEAIGMAINALQEEPVSEELEEASFDYAEACKYDGGEKLLCVEHFKAGAKWKKEQIMKDAVNGLVFTQRTNGEVMFRSNYVKKEGFEFGDKVKVIVIKEE